MRQIVQIIGTSFIQALQELRANKLRTTLSLLGITIGIFCIIAVLTVLDSMKQNIATSVETLGSDVLYIGRWPWTAEGGEEYKWWEYVNRPGMSPREVRAVEQLAGVQFATLSLQVGSQQVKYYDNELEGVSVVAVAEHFDRIQNVEIAEGRYLTAAELDGGNFSAVIGMAVYVELFQGNADAIGKAVTLMGRKFTVTGILKESGQNMAGFDFDNSIILPYNAIGAMLDTRSLNYDPTLMVKAAPGVSVTELGYEVEGVLRTLRKVKPGDANNFSVNQLSQVQGELNRIFAMINLVGIVIAGFSLLVGSFGIANIMFVTVKERTKIIGLKMAVGARTSVILKEFLLEAVMLCIIGGLAGIMIVFVLSLLLTYVADFPISLNFRIFFTGIFVSVVVGVLAGYIPARSAARLNPVTAIRST